MMTDKRSAYERCVADLEMARMLFKRATSRQNSTASEIHRVAVDAKRLEVKLAAAKMAQAEYHLDALRARIDYLESRVARDRATRREEAELEWARGALPVNTATVERLAAELEQRKQELNALSEINLVSTDAAA
jgi:hypothetical protein